MDDKNISLSNCFEKGYYILNELDNSQHPMNSKEYQDKVEKGIQMLEKATVMVSELSLFSINEALEEITTQDLKYLLLPALLGSFTTKISNRERLEVLEIAEIYFIDYLRRLNLYGFSNAKIPHNVEGDTICTDDKSQRQTLNSLQSLEKAAVDRKAKIERFQKLKELNQRRTELQKRMDNEELDEERVREFYQVTLNAWIYTASDELESIKQEKPLVRLMMEMKASGKTLEKKGPAHKPLKPIIIARNEVQKKVLGIGYPSRPVLTVDEFYAQRYGDQHAEENPTGFSMQKWAEDPQRAKDELDVEAQEKEEKEEREDQNEIHRARDWDDWKDDHRRGWGNRKNMG